MARPAAGAKTRRNRGPAAVIPLPAAQAPKTNGKKKTATQKSRARARGTAQVPDDDDDVRDDEEKEEEEEDPVAMEDVEDMVDYGSDSAGSSSSRAARPGPEFLTSLDVNAISMSRAELARIKKTERKQQRSDLKMNQKLATRGRRSSALSPGASAGDDGGESGEDAYETEFDDTDLPSDSGDSDVDIGSDVYEYSSESGDDMPKLDTRPESSAPDRSDTGSGPDLDSDSVSEDDEDDNDKGAELEDEETREDKRIQQRAAQAKRKRKEDELASAKLAKRARLPVRGEEGWQDKMHAGTDDEDEDDDKDRVVRKRADLPESESEQDEGADELARKAAAAMPHPSILTGSRFGMLAPYAVMRLEPRSKRVASAREQLARLAQTVMADPEESSIGLVRRMVVFARPTVRPPKVAAGQGASGIEADPAKARKLKPIPVDDAIRAAAVLSLMAIFSDILPGYRIRQLTEAERSETVSHEVRRRREFEQGIIEVYRDFLELCEDLVKHPKSDLMPIGARALTTLLLREPQFNYRTNIIRVIVACLSRASWTPISELCASTLIDLLKADNGGDISLEVVRLLHRMIKERRYQVHAAVLDVLLHLRLRSELGATRASMTTSDLPNRKKQKGAEIRKSEGKALSKKEVKRQRELKAIEREMAEADAEVDVEERAKHQTETVKLLFVLYFSILKTEGVPSSLLGSALEGLSVYAHRISVDFFSDLLAVLRVHVERARGEAEAALTDEQEGMKNGEDPLGGRGPFEARLHDALLCLSTSFELLSGQGAALNIDLSDMVNQLYGVLQLATLSTALEEAPMRHGKLLGARGRGPTHVRSSSELLFHTLDFVLLRPSVHALPLPRGAAFAKRLLTASLQWPAMTATRALRTINVMLARDARLAALFDGEDRARDGRYDGVTDSPDMAHVLASGMSAWEVHLLRRHANADVRAEAVALVSAAKSAGK